MASTLVQRSTVFVANSRKTIRTASARLLHVMRRTTVDDVVVRARKMAPSLLRRLMIVVADTLEGKIIYARLLPRISGLYCDGHTTFKALRFIHDVEKIVKQFLRETGLDWGKLAASRLCRSPAVRQALLQVVRPADDHASNSVTSCAFYDKDTRPHLLMVPWRPGWPVLLPASWMPAVVTRRCSIPRPRSAHQLLDDQTMMPLVTARYRGPNEPVDDHASNALTSCAFYDKDTRPHLLMVPWRPGWPVLLPASWMPAVVTRRCSIPRPTSAHQLLGDDIVVPLLIALNRGPIESVDDHGQVQLDHDRKTSSDVSDVTFFSLIVLTPLAVFWTAGM
ncbi:unnamed protein product [Macrosiphum euphorbiae]|uniref:Uncharacterized protein n=1 Tax=Macrosiphum euphorbiae TaxID=13131 RepID=A0AAV0X470_9HEMI|nr:unnamed protein product [Macrosiphum euphorbiae]